ncbi:hypothetical protein JYU34_021874 [Plutella xylostella]|uniref:MBD domain-containing protein n=1 Tax=Plutella xylostella TaxID=51655 RepID=A0ABQ7PT59_PLUXY|nr:hypothetical protein JYU34_021874 [Plutella xylostella]
MTGVGVGGPGCPRPALAPGQVVLAMRHAFGSWMRASVLEVSSKAQFSVCKVRFEHKVKNAVVSITARHLAYADPAPVRLTIGTRVVALFSDVSDSTKRKSFYSGVIAEMPNPVNSYRYLVFFDDGYAQYVSHGDVRVVCECSSLVWEEVHPFSREFVRQYLRAYPERPMVRLHEGQSLKTEWNGKWWISKVLKTDASLVQVYFEADNRSEWIYRGSTRLAPLYLELQAAERPRNRPLPRSTQNRGIEKQNMPYVEYTRTEEQEQNKADAQTQQQQQEEYIKRQRAVAKKSTALPTPPPKHPQPLDNVMSRVVYYTPKAAVKPLKMVPHSCGPSCRRADVLPLRELRTYNPLARPLLSGWERQIVRYKGRKEVMYRAPCGRRLRDMRELHAYLRATQSDMTVDLFHFGAGTHCLAEFLLTRCIVSKKVSVKSAKVSFK